MGHAGDGAEWGEIDVVAGKVADNGIFNVIQYMLGHSCPSAGLL